MPVYVKKLCFLLTLFCVQGIYADEYELNEFSLHADASKFALGGLVCNYEPLMTDKLGITCLVPFQLKELSTRKLSLIKNALGLSWSVDWYQSGDADWMENNLGLHIEKKIGEHLWLGVQGWFLIVDTYNVNSRSTCFAELDCRYILSDRFRIAFLLMNPGGARITSEIGKIPLSSTAHLGMRYSPANKCRLFCEMAVPLKHTVRGQLGMEYSINDAFILRIGLSSRPLMPTWGLGGKVNRFQYSWGGSLHPVLGISNGFTLDYCL